jgi:hypothetical protein
MTPRPAPHIDLVFVPKRELVERHQLDAIALMIGGGGGLAAVEQLGSLPIRASVQA